MKKLVFILLLLPSFLFVWADNKIDIFDFINQFDWTQTKKEIEKKYKDRIVLGGELEKTIEFSGIVLGDYDLSFNVLFADGGNMPTGLSFYPKLELFLSLGYAEIASDIDSIMDEKFGEPNIPYGPYHATMLEDKSVIAVKVWENIKGLKGITLTQRTMTLSSLDLLVVAYIASPSNLITKEKTEPDFRKGYWGDSRRVIEERERKRDEFNLDNIYSFSTTVAGLSCIAAYRFTNDKLTSAKYLFDNISVYNCIENYDNLFGLLKKKYGDPVENEEENIASERQRSIYTEGELVRDGRLLKSALFLSPFSYIFIKLSGGDGFSLLIEYYSVEHDNEREADVLRDL